MENFEDFNPRTGCIIGRVADNMEWSRSDVAAAVIDNDPAFELPNDHFDKLIDTDVDAWCDEILPIASYLVEVGYIELPSKKTFDKHVDFARFISAVRKEAQKTN